MITACIGLFIIGAIMTAILFALGFLAYCIESYLFRDKH
jgi:hypothetical protein